MWFGLYSRYNKKMDSSGFEHIFAGSDREDFLSITTNVLQIFCFSLWILRLTHSVIIGEIKGGKVSGFHNWIQFYLLEKRGQLNYYSHSFNGPVRIPNTGVNTVCWFILWCVTLVFIPLFLSFPCSQWTTYPDVMGMQFKWDGYFKQVGSAVIGCSPEFDFALYSLCYITRPGKQWVYLQVLWRFLACESFLIWIFFFLLSLIHRCRLSLGGKELIIQTYTWDNSFYGDGKKFIGSAFPATPRNWTKTETACV